MKNEGNGGIFRRGEGKEGENGFAGWMNLQKNWVGECGNKKINGHYETGAKCGMIQKKGLNGLRRKGNSKVCGMRS